MELNKRVLLTIANTTVDCVKKGSQAYIQHEHRGHVYHGAIGKVQGNFGRPEKVAQGISELLSGWHNTFYRFGPFNQSEVLKCVIGHHGKLAQFRTKNIREVRLDTAFEAAFKPVFDGLLNATASTNSRFTRRTVTGTSKALGLLAPSLFPMCDEAISQAYDCWWVYSDFGFVEYSKFMNYVKILAEKLVSQYCKQHAIGDARAAETQLVNEIRGSAGVKFQYDSLLKIIDEYNYAKHTKG